ncbi:MAG: geranylgeranylglyceryl/heptaprenylglyceryl phosphate synthase [Bacteroidetes bacterium RIFCSPLOWO2_12_FULL_35_15]|nr:MAG: geranylgeranylglyceryl/heptaprenylglyceryl phosphate synthase [Bacteroidetes bacterium RIFCSPLOWO2_12_FULL_35_15]
MQKTIFSSILKSKALRKKQFAVLIDPDKFESSNAIEISETGGVDFIFVGGSILTNGNFEECITSLKKKTKIPIIIFPGNNLQISKNADGILLLSLISGRNPELLIGKQVIAAPILKASNLDILPTGYILIDGGKPTAVSYMSNTNPIPFDKDDIAMCTAMAGEMLGLKLIYMDAGSGALNAISEKMIKKVSSNISIPLIIGGGINTPQKAILACKAGADIIVVGNAIEKDSSLIKKIGKAVHSI